MAALGELTRVGVRPIRRLAGTVARGEPPRTVHGRGPRRSAGARIALLLPSFVAALTLTFGLPSRVAADHIVPFDQCVGVDHPPFDRQYAGDGASYINIGLFFHLSQLRGNLRLYAGVSLGNDLVLTSSRLDALGGIFFSSPINQFGQYDWGVYLDEARTHEVASGTITVGPDEPPCSLEQLG